jgi:Flp pilus assembly protein TadG
MISSRRLASRLRHAVLTHLGSSESGITFVVFAVAIVVILGMVAVGVDGGRLYDERRKAQNAADHAAATAAHAVCSRRLTTGQAITAGEASALTNGYDNNGATNTVTVAHVAGTRFTATIETTIPSTFAVIIGWENLTTGGAATAECNGSKVVGPGAVYAGGTCPGGKYAFEVSGSTNEVYGGVHANDDVRVGGSGNDFSNLVSPEDPFTYVGSMDPGAGNSYEPGYPYQVPMPSPVWPTGWDPSVVDATFLALYEAQAVANGTFFTGKVTSITKDGVFYTTSSEGMDISSVTGSTRNVVLVAPNGPIKISASDKTFNPWQPPSPELLPRDGILMLSDKTYPAAADKCDKYVIAVSGSSSTWNGIMWAPNGLIEMSGSFNETEVKGTLVGHAVRLNGSDLDIEYESDVVEQEPWVQMVQ